MRKKTSRYLGYLSIMAGTFVTPLVLAAGPDSAAGGSPTRLASVRRVSFDEGWRFRLGDAAGAQNPAFNDSDWTQVTVPHDWAIDGPFDAALNPHTGALPIAGIGWYRKTFSLPAARTKRYYAIEFDGAMSNSRVWLNGHELGGRPYGYIGFSFDLTPYLLPKARHNVLVVRLAPEANSSRWYPGAGIYRNVWLDHDRSDPCRAMGHLRYNTARVERVGHGRSAYGTAQSTGRVGSSNSTLRRFKNQAGARWCRVRHMPSCRPEAARGDHEPAHTEAAPLGHGQPYLYAVVTEVLHGTTLSDKLRDSVRRTYPGL